MDDAMELHGVVELVVHVHDFRNVDLFTQGLYFLRTYLYSEAETQIAVPYGVRAGGSPTDTAAALGRLRVPPSASFQAAVDHERHCFSTRNFLIRYRDESVTVDEMAFFRIELPMVEGEAYPTDSMILEVELVFADIHNPKVNPLNADDFKVVARQRFRLLHLGNGDSVYVPCTFDELHFCLAQLTIHSCLVDFRFKRPDSRVIGASTVMHKANDGRLKTRHKQHRFGKTMRVRKDGVRREVTKPGQSVAASAKRRNSFVVQDGPTAGSFGLTGDLSRRHVGGNESDESDGGGGARPAHPGSFTGVDAGARRRSSPAAVVAPRRPVVACLSTCGRSCGDGSGKRPELPETVLMLRVKYLRYLRESLARLRERFARFGKRTHGARALAGTQSSAADDADDASDEEESDSSQGPDAAAREPTLALNGAHRAIPAGPEDDEDTVDINLVHAMAMDVYHLWHGFPELFHGRYTAICAMLKPAYEAARKAKWASAVSVDTLPFDSRAHPMDRAWMRTMQREAAEKRRLFSSPTWMPLQVENLNDYHQPIIAEERFVPELAAQQRDAVAAEASALAGGEHAADEENAETSSEDGSNDDAAQASDELANPPRAGLLDIVADGTATRNGETIDITIATPRPPSTAATTLGRDTGDLPPPPPLLREGTVDASGDGDSDFSDVSKEQDEDASAAEKKDKTAQAAEKGKDAATATSDDEGTVEGPQPADEPEGVHLFVMCHGLQGNPYDLRLLKDHILLQNDNAVFLMSSTNREMTMGDINLMGSLLAEEVVTHIRLKKLTLGRISFIGHSLGSVIIRAALRERELDPLRPFMYTYMSLSGPHLGIIYNQNKLVGGAMSVLKTTRKSECLAQLTLKDAPRIEDTFIYKLAMAPGLADFRHVAFVASPQDRYVPFHSARVDCIQRAAMDRREGSAYFQMVHSLLDPLKDTSFSRFNIFFEVPPRSIDGMIGRAAHIEFLENLTWHEMFVTSYRKYFS